MPFNTSNIDTDFKKQTIRNISTLMNDEPLNIAQCFDYFNEPYMKQFFEIYREYACEPSTFLHCILTTIGALSDDIKLSNVLSHNDTSINLMTHIIGEPGERYLSSLNIYFQSFIGSQKSTMINVIRHALTILETLFPDVFVKQKHDSSIGIDANSRDFHLLVQNDTELGLTKTLASRVRKLILLCFGKIFHQQ